MLGRCPHLLGFESRIPVPGCDRSPGEGVGMGGWE